MRINPNTTVVVAAAGILLGACSMVPRPVSPPPQPTSQGFRAGFARVDITPPPGGGLFGYGPEGKMALGYRMRLYARAMVLEDASGERIAFVVTDLGANSVLVHRFAARATKNHGIGADRLLLAASHTHAGPTHHFGLIHDLFASGGAIGFNWSWSMELSDRVAAAVELAVADLQQARAGWKTYPVWGVTHNRNLIPYMNNAVPWRSHFEPVAGLTTAQQGIDPAWTLLRIDRRSSDGRWRPAGALSIFAIHGTGSPSANELYDADLHGMVSSAIERGIDEKNGLAKARTPSAFHLFAQGSEGDASAMPAYTRCPVPTLKNPEEFGPSPELSIKLLNRPEIWQPPPPEALHQCIYNSRERMNAVAQIISKKALQELEGIETNDDVHVRRVFTTIYPKDLHDQFCKEPRLGTATLAGPIDGTTRQMHARVRYIEEGGTAVDPGPHRAALRKCHVPKRFLSFKVPLLRRITQSNIYNLNLTPREAQLAVIQVGPQILATVPAELTTTAGGRIKDAIAAELKLEPGQVAAVSIVNGYLNYVATGEEYLKQHYEGSSTLFGPNSAEAFKNILVQMSQKLPRNGAASPEPIVGKALVWRDAVEIHNFGDFRKKGPERVLRCIDRITVRNDTLSFLFRDWYPGRFMRAHYPLLQIEARAAGGQWYPLTWDDDPQLEIQAIAKDGRRGYWWRARWTPDVLPAASRFKLTKRGPNEEITSDQSASTCR